MRLKLWCAAMAGCCVLAMALADLDDYERQPSQKKTTTNDGENSENQQQQQPASSPDRSAADQIETASEIEWNELQEYLEERLAGVFQAEGNFDERPTIQLQFMADGDSSLSLEDDDSDQMNDDDNNSNNNNEVVVQGTISEIPAPDSNGGEQKDRAERDRIVATETDWTFIQDNLNLQGQGFSFLRTLTEAQTEDDATAAASSRPEPPEEQLTEDEVKGKELYDKARQMTTLTRSNRQSAYNLYVRAAEFGYLPAKERVAWAKLLGSSTRMDLESARKTFQELSQLGRPDSQMVTH